MGALVIKEQKLGSAEGTGEWTPLLELQALVRGRWEGDGEKNGGQVSGRGISAQCCSWEKMVARALQPQDCLHLGGLHSNLQALFKAMAPGLLSRVQLSKEGMIVAAHGESRAPETVEIWRNRQDMLSLIFLPSPTFTLLSQTCHRFCCCVLFPQCRRQNLGKSPWISKSKTWQKHRKNRHVDTKKVLHLCSDARCLRTPNRLPKFCCVLAESVQCTYYAC